MKYFSKLFLFALALLAAGRAAAVVNMSLSLDRDRYLRYEPIEATITIRNDSGNPLVFSVGQSKRTLTAGKRQLLRQLLSEEEYRAQGVETSLVISPALERLVNRKLLMLPPEQRPGIQKQLAEQPGDQRENCSLEILVWKDDEPSSVPQALVTSLPLETLGQLPAGDSREATFTLNRLVKVGAPGRYKLKIQLRHDRFPDVCFATPSIGFDVLDGNVIWERTFGLPTGNTGEAIRTRQVKLKSLVANKVSLYYLELSGPDAQGRQAVFLIARLCDYTLGTKPQVEIDGVNNIHVVFMSYPRFYEYRVYDYNGKNLVRRFLKSVSSIPILRYDPEYTMIRVVGGDPAAEGTDYVFTDESRREAAPTPGFSSSAQKQGGTIPPASPAAPAPSKQP